MSRPPILQVLERKIRMIAFDLDGTLFEGKIIHYEAFNRALKEVINYQIPMEDHTRIYDGLPTREKIERLEEKFGKPFTTEQKKKIQDLKQKYTIQLLDDKKFYDKRLEEQLIELNSRYQLCCVSNAVRQTVDTILYKLGVEDYFTFKISNQDCRNPKPHAEPYIRAMVRGSTMPEETLVIEDNYNGFESAINAGCHLFKVSGPNDIIASKILDYIHMKEEEMKGWKK